MEYYIIIAASIIIIMSYLFNWVSRRTNFPSVLLLIFLGVVIKELLSLFGGNPEKALATLSEIKLLELLGTLGLIMIVLEAALDLKVERNKLGLIGRASGSAFFGLMATSFATGYLIMAAIPQLGFIQAMIYATPLSILSSAIVIPSVENLNDEQREFHIYESTISDILGIMMFYFLLSLAGSTNNVLVVGDFSVGLILTIVISVTLSYFLLYLFQKLETKVKLFLMISVLILLFSIGKLMHLSSLIIILIFGLVLSNHRTFFRGRLKNLIDYETTDKIYDSFHLITMESAFVIRTFFFVIFGFTVTLGSLFSIKIAVVSGLILLCIYLIRALILKLIVKQNVMLATYIAPRGLITLLLYYSIPAELETNLFNEGILLFVIIITSLLMTFGLVRYGLKPDKDSNSEEKEVSMEDSQ